MSSPTPVTTNDLRVVVLTPAGRGAVATVLVQGPAAMDAVGQCFQPLSRRKLTAYAAGDIVVGNFVNANGTREELVVGIVSAGRVEIHCHGGRAAVEAVVETLGDLGGHRCPWEVNAGASRGESIQTEAIVALAQATTERAAGVLLDQYRGALCEAVQKVLGAAAQSLVDEALALIDELFGRVPVGLHLTTPWRVAIAGRPNVGKSSLINALVGYERAIVFDQPGTTRDVLTARTALHGWPVELLDTAGLRESIDPLESAGIERAQSATAGADLALVVFEASAPWTADDRALLKQLGGGDFLVVYNKLDLGEPAADGRPSGVAISARSGTNLDQLTAAIAQRMVPKSIEAGMAVPFTRRQVEALTAAREALAAGDTASAVHQLRSLLEINSAGHSIP